MEPNEVQVILVDENDNATGLMPKTEAHRKARLHRAVSVFIFNTKGEWLLQRRAWGKYHSGGLWSNSCCSHPFPNESNAAAAARRLHEEMGISCELTELFYFIYKEPLDNELTEHELDHVFAGFTDDIPVINPNEVHEFRLTTYSELKTDMAKNPEDYTVWFRKIAERVQQHIEHLRTSSK